MAEARFQRIVPVLKVTLVAAMLATAGCSEMAAHFNHTWTLPDFDEVG